MGVTFVSSSGGDIPTGTIVLWYGMMATIPDGWTYYSSAAGYWVKGALSANVTPQNTTNHTHAYASKTGSGGAHNTHGFTVSSPSSSPSGNTVDTYAEGTWDYQGAMSTHTHATAVGTIGQNTGHDHSVSSTGGSSLIPVSVGLYFIKRTG